MKIDGILKVAGIVTGIGSAVFAVIACAADTGKEEAAKEAAKELAKEAITDEDKAILDEFDETFKAYDEILRKERSQVDTRMANWKKSSGYDKKVGAIKTKFWDDCDTFRRDNDISGRISKAESNANDLIKARKQETGYDAKILEFKKEIENANAQYEAQKAVAKSVGKLNENFEDGAKELKKAAKKAKDAVVESAQASINELNKELNDFKASVYKKRDKIIEEVKLEETSGIGKLKTERDEGLLALKKEHDNKLSEIKKSVLSVRSEENQKIAEKMDDLSCKKSKITKKSDNFAGKALSNMSSDEKLAASLVNDGFSPVGFTILGLMPVGFACVCAFKYVSWIFKVAKAMKNWI